LDGGLNVYAYVANNPIMLIDPLGLCGSSALDWVQGGLDLAGLIPGIGEPVDLLNAGISAARGNYVEAGFSLAAAIPFIGWGGTAGKAALKYSDNAAALIGAGSKNPLKVLVDSNATTGLRTDPSLGGRILPGEQPTISYITRPEMQNAVVHGNLRGVPKVIDGLPTLCTRPSLDLRINIRGQLPARGGRFGDGIIGAQALENNIPLITNDKALRQVIQSMGGNVR
jgi:hypothetical protein